MKTAVCLVSFVLLIYFKICVSIDLVQEVKSLKAQNARLFDVVNNLERRLSAYETAELEKSLIRRQYEGPYVFTYRVDKLRLNIHEGTAINFSTRVTDLGGGYDNATGIFTAPRAGVYLFTCSLLADQGTSHHVNAKLHASIMVGGHPAANVFAYAQQGMHRDQGANTVFLNLKVGSQVWVKAIDAAQITVSGEMYSTFSGYLLWQY